MWSKSRLGIAVVAVLTTSGGAAQGQSLADRVTRAPEGVVRFGFPVDPWVCGDDDAVIVRDPADREKGSVSIFRGSYQRGSGWRARCSDGPASVRLRSSGGRITGVSVGIAESPGAAGGTDLGEVAAQEAADYLLELAARLPSSAGEDAILGAVIARDARVHPQLMRLALGDAIPTQTRRSAVFWMGQEGAPLAELRRVYASVPAGVREQVLFVYSQRREPEAARELLRVARSEAEPRALREKAVFWLGQAAGDAATRDLDGIAGDEGIDVGVREQAVFTLSQRPGGEGVPALIQIARRSPDPRLRKKAIFWLGQSGDSRALSLFQELLGIR